MAPARYHAAIRGAGLRRLKDPIDVGSTNLAEIEQSPIFGPDSGRKDFPQLNYVLGFIRVFTGSLPVLLGCAVVFAVIWFSGLPVFFSTPLAIVAAALIVYFAALFRHQRNNKR